MQEWFGVSIGLIATLEHEIAGCFERDTPVVVVAHAMVGRIAGILLVDNHGHAPHRFHDLLFGAKAVF